MTTVMMIVIAVTIIITKLLATIAIMGGNPDKFLGFRLKRSRGGCTETTDRSGHCRAAHADTRSNDDEQLTHETLPLLATGR